MFMASEVRSQDGASMGVAPVPSPPRMPLLTARQGTAQRKHKTPQSIGAWKAAWHAHDADEDGQMDASGLTQVLLELGRKDLRAAEMIQAFDSDGNGLFCFGELCAFLAQESAVHELEETASELRRQKSVRASRQVERLRDEQTAKAMLAEDQDEYREHQKLLRRESFRTQEAGLKQQQKRKLKKLLRAAKATFHGMSPTELAAELDTDGDGIITPQELWAKLKGTSYADGHELQEGDLAAIIAELDSDHNGVLSVQEVLDSCA